MREIVIVIGIVLFVTSQRMLDIFPRDDEHMICFWAGCLAVTGGNIIAATFRNWRGITTTEGKP